MPDTPPPGRTGAPAGLLQDDSRELSAALSRDPAARLHVREARAAITPPEAPEVLAAETEAVLQQLDDRTNQTWANRRKRWACLVRAQAARIAELERQLVRERDT